MGDSVFRGFEDQSGLRGYEISGHYSEEMAAELRKNPPDRLVIRSGTWEGYDFLREDWAKKVVGCINEDGDAPIAGMIGLENVEKLSLGVETKEQFSFCGFGRLKYFVLLWQKNFSLDLFELPTLEEVYLDKFDRVNLEDLPQSSGIRKLELSYGKLQSLRGIGSLRNLRWLALTQLRKLGDISDLSGNSSIETLCIESCNGIEDYSVIGEMTNLKRLFIENKSIPSISFMENLLELEEFQLAHTNLQDGDLSVLTQLPRLKSVAIRNKRHYKPSVSEIEAALAQ